MKKTTTLLICGILLLGMFGCRTADPNADPAPEATAAQSERQTEETNAKVTAEGKDETTAEIAEETTEQFCFAGEEYAELEEYLQTEWEKKYGDADINSTDQQISVMVPVMKSADFDLVRIKDNDSAILYTFCPVGEEPIYYGATNCIEVRYFPYPTSYEHLMQSPQYEFDPQNDAINYFGRWILGIEGYCFEIIFPGTMVNEDVFVTFEQLNELFAFEMITYSPAQ